MELDPLLSQAIAADASDVLLNPGAPPSMRVNGALAPMGAEPLDGAPLQRLVLAQDTGSAITGAVRADYFAGWGADAGELAGRLRQSLQLWTLWPKPGQ